MYSYISSLARPRSNRRARAKKRVITGAVPRPRRGPKPPPSAPAASSARITRRLRLPWSTGESRSKLLRLPVAAEPCLVARQRVHRERGGVSLGAPGDLVAEDRLRIEEQPGLPV